MRRHRRSIRARVALGAGLAAQLFAVGCIPYTVGSTARPVARGHSGATLSMFVMPPASTLDSSRAVPFLAADTERRFGIDNRSDVGLRIPSGSGVIVNYKRLLTDSNARMMVAIMPGAGFVNLGDHAHFEFTLVASRWEPPQRPQGNDTITRPRFVPYGGLRLMQVAPLNSDAVHDRPTVGGFLGVRIGSTDLGVSPEVGVFYDHSALGFRRGDLVVVPAISLHGQRLISIIRGVGRPFFFPR